jgi:DNA-directed RNA polymerase specialized sigma24 family protein
LLHYYRPSYDSLSREEQRDLVDATVERVNAFLKASRQLVEFLEYGVPNRKQRAALQDANRDVRAAVLSEVEGLSSPRIAERFGLSLSDAYKTKH